MTLKDSRSDRPLVANTGELRALVHQVREEVAREERPWTADEAAGFLTFKPETIRRWARTGKIPTLGKVAGEWRFDPAVIRALLSGAAPQVPSMSAQAAYTQMMRERSA